MPNDFLENTCEKGQKQKSEHRYWILSVCNSLGIKFQTKLTIFDFWTKLTKKGYFQSKKENSENNHSAYSN